MANTTLFLQAKTGDSAVNYTGTQFRQMIGAAWPPAGVLQSSQAFTDLNVTQRAAGANMSVDVAAGAAIVNCTSISNGGQYYSREDTTVNLVIPSAPGTGTLKHRIVELVRDPQNDAGQTLYGGTPFVVAGTNNTGALPALPNNCVELAQVTVAAGTASITNAMITDVRCIAALPGQLIGSNGPNTSNTNSAATAGTEQVVGNNTTIRLSEASVIRVEYVMTVRATDASVTNIEGKLRRASGTSGPGTGGTFLYSTFAYVSGNTNTQATIRESYVESLSAGTYTYGIGVQGNGGRAWKDGSVNPSFMNVFYVGPA